MNPGRRLATDASNVARLEDVLKFFFSGLLLAAVAIILGGQWLAQCLNLSKRSDAFFRVPLPGIFRVEARGNEVGIGLTAFVAVFLLIALPAGEQAYSVVRTRIGIDLGQFDSLCVLSAFVTLVTSFVVFLVVVRPWIGPDPLVDEQQRRLENLESPVPTPQAEDRAQ
jgi:hypothetical protein